MHLQVKEERYNELLKKIREYFVDAELSIHKARNEIKVISFSGQNLVVKSFKIPNIINKFVYTFFKDSKARKSYRNSIKIIDFVPKPIGYIEFKKFGLLDESYFVSENFEYDFTIREPLLDPNFDNKEKIFREFAKFSYDLHQKDIYHLDYSPGNILIKKQNDDFVFKIVDINRMQFKTLSLNERLKNFSKLWAKDEDLEIIVKAYAELIHGDEKLCVAKALAYSQDHKYKKNIKKRLKGKKVVD